MLLSFDLQFLFIFILFPLILSQCFKEVNVCFNKFASDLEAHKKKLFKTTVEQLNDICSRENGIYFQFTGCITAAEQPCASDAKFTQYLCETRKLKMKISRYNWKPNLFYDICHDTSSELSQGFIRHEPCISEVLNDRKWKCDRDYDKPIKAMKDWRQKINNTCSLWRKFRDCSKTDVKQKCGIEASNISDYLFHTHQSYFDKYNTCDLEGHSSNQCWYNLFKQSTKTSVTVTSAESSSLIESTNASTTEQTRTTEQSLSTTEQTHTTEQSLSTTEQTHTIEQSLSTNTSFNTFSSAQSSESVTYSSSSAPRLEEADITTGQTLNSSNYDLSSKEHDAFEYERVLHLNDSAEKESEISKKSDIVLADTSLYHSNSPEVENDSRPSNNHNNDKLTYSSDHNNPNSKESVSLNYANTLKVELVLFFLVLPVKFLFHTQC